MSYKDDNVFAKIIHKECSAKIVYEDTKVLAFHDIDPIAPIHIIVIPKTKYIDYDDFIDNNSIEDISYYFKIIVHIIKMFDLRDSGYRLITNKGLASGQSVFHFHFHIIGGKVLEQLI